MIMSMNSTASDHQFMDLQMDDSGAARSSADQKLPDNKTAKPSDQQSAIMSRGSSMSESEDQPPAKQFQFNQENMQTRDPLVAQMREILEGSSAPAEDLEAKAADLKTDDQTNEQACGHECQKQQKRHRYTASRHHHHHSQHCASRRHHHHHAHQQPAQEAGTSEQLVDDQGKPLESSASNRHRHHHHHHHHHHHGHHAHHHHQAHHSRQSSHLISSERSLVSSKDKDMTVGASENAEPSDDPQAAEGTSNEEASHHHRHHHHHHHSRHHCRQLKRRPPAESADLANAPIEAADQAPATTDAGQRQPLQELAANQSHCPYHEQHCQARDSSSGTRQSHGHHHHHHHHHHQGHGHQHRHSRSGPSLGAGGQESGVQGGEQVRGHSHHHHHHHRHHAHYHHGHRGHHQHHQSKGTGHRQRRQRGSVGQTSMSAAEEPANKSAAGIGSQSDKLAEETVMQTDNPDDLAGGSRGQQATGIKADDEVVNMEMSPNASNRHTIGAETNSSSQLIDGAEELANNVVASIEIVDSSKQLATTTSPPTSKEATTATTTKNDENQNNIHDKVYGGEHQESSGANGTKKNLSINSATNQESLKGSRGSNATPATDGLIEPMRDAASTGRENRKSSNKGTTGISSQQMDSSIEFMPVQNKSSFQSNTIKPKQMAESSVSPDRRCRLCWCCCCPCSGLSNRNNPGKNETSSAKPSTNEGLSLNARCPSLSNISLDVIRSWGESFDKLMKCPEGRKVFQEFLRCEYSEENILFWIACEELKSARDAQDIEGKARDIYEDYISILSAKEVSLDSRVRDIINNNIKKPTSNIFDEAQLQIYTLMHRDSYPRFINSQMYKKLAQIQNTSRKSSS